MLSAFRRLFNKRPLLGNTIIYGTLFAGAEVSQQVVIRKLQARSEQQPEPLDRESIKRYCIFGYVVLPPILHTWYKWLDWKYVGVGLRMVAKKVFLDVFVMGPIDVFVFFYSMAWMEGKEDKMAELRAKYVDTVLKEIYFWVPAQVLNFVLVPPAFRVIFVGACAFAWNNILCWVKRAEFNTAEDIPQKGDVASENVDDMIKVRRKIVNVEEDGNAGQILKAWNEAVRSEEGHTGVILNSWNKAICDREANTVLLNNGPAPDSRSEVHDTTPKLLSRPEIQELLPFVTSVTSVTSETAADDAC